MGLPNFRRLGPSRSTLQHPSSRENLDLRILSFYFINRVTGSIALLDSLLARFHPPCFKSNFWSVFWWERARWSEQVVSQPRSERAVRFVNVTWYLFWKHPEGLGSSVLGASIRVCVGCFPTQLVVFPDEKITLHPQLLPEMRSSSGSASEGSPYFIPLENHNYCRRGVWSTFWKAEYERQSEWKH